MKKIALIFCCLVVFASCKKTKKTIPTKIEKKEIYTISNDSLTVSVKSFGAELTSIKKASKEYLWQGNPDFWKHQSPILFPIVGRLVDHEFKYKDSIYKMPFHGFASKEDFIVVELHQNKITLELTSNKEIKKQYPFDFKLQIQYIIVKNTLAINYKVINISEVEDLYFSIGAHPAFNIPLEKGQLKNEYQLVFDAPAMPTSRNKISGLFANSYTQFFNKPGVLQLQDTTFNHGALVFNPNPFSKATLVHEPSQKKIFTIHFKDFPYLGIWAVNKPNTPFIAIEPWYGLAESIHHTKEFTQKEGIQILKPKEVFRSSFSVEIY